MLKIMSKRRRQHECFIFIIYVYNYPIKTGMDLGFQIRGLEYKEKKMCYIHNIFTTNPRWLVVIVSNLKPLLKLFFLPTNNTQ